MTGHTDHEIIIKIQQGDIDQFSFLVKKYLKKITQYARQYITDRDEREDVIQNTFLNFYKSISRYDSKRPLWPYLLTIAKNEVKMSLRQRKKTISLDAALDTIAAPEHSRFDLGAALKSVSQKQKAVLQLIADGYSYLEISKKLSIPVNTIKTEVRRARIKLKKIYG